MSTSSQARLQLREREEMAGGTFSVIRFRKAKDYQHNTQDFRFETFSAFVE